MKTSARVRREFHELLAFLSNLWGLFVALTLILPVANWLLSIVPLAEAHQRGGTGLAILTCFYALVYTFAERHRFRARLRAAGHSPAGWEPESWSLRSAFDRFGWALVCFTLYMVFHLSYVQLSSQSGAFAQMAVPILSPLALVSYGSLFGLLTASFGELAIIEYVKECEREPVPTTE